MREARRQSLSRIQGFATWRARRLQAHMEESVQDKELYRSRVTINEQEYVLQNISDEPVVFVVEQNVPNGWQVDSDPQPGELIPASVGDRKLDKVAVFRVHADPGQDRAAACGRAAYQAA